MSLTNDLLKHQIFIQRLIGTEVESIKASLSYLRNKAVMELKAGTLAKPLRSVLRNSIKGLKDTGVANMTDIAVYESKFSANIMSKVFKTDIQYVEATKLKTALQNTNMSINYLTGGESATKKSLATAYKQFAQRKADDIIQVILDSKIKNFTEVDTIKAIDERINGLLTSQAKSLAATAVNYATALARSQTIEQNNVTQKIIWRADAEVNEHCSECDDLDGNEYNLNDVDEPPLHWGCACYLEPVEGDGNENE